MFPPIGNPLYPERKKHIFVCDFTVRVGVAATAVGALVEHDALVEELDALLALETSVDAVRIRVQVSQNESN